jgi:endo-alpha-1,4-polygalactosaminidase (GH114 family)
MPAPNNSSGIRDNHNRGSVADFLKAKIQEGSRLSVVSAYFTIYAYDALKQHLDSIEHLDWQGFSGGVNLETLNWGNFDLVVIDESHNFRNNTPWRRDEEGNLIRKSRYQRLMGA